MFVYKQVLYENGNGSLEEEAATKNFANVDKSGFADIRGPGDSYNLVAGMAQNSGLEVLRDKSIRSDETEIRIGLGGGTAYTTWFIFKKNESKTSAFLISPWRKDKTFRRKPLRLSEPKLGWNRLDRLLSDEGVRLPIDLGVESDTPKLLDGINLVVEIKSGSKHDYRWFEKRSATVDSDSGIEKLRRLMLRIGNEFNMKKEFGFPRGK